MAYNLEGQRVPTVEYLMARKFNMEFNFYGLWQNCKIKIHKLHENISMISSTNWDSVK